MKSILDIEVSCFANYQTADNPKVINIIQWLTSNKYANHIDKLRFIEDKAERDQIKAKLPAITPSGTFSYRSNNCLIRHSGLLQFDIDFKDNQHIDNYLDLKDQLCKIQNVAYCGLSASGRGYWGLIPIAYPEKHKEHFDALQQDFANYEIIIDDKPKNVASLRGYSWDPEGSFNHKAKVYKKFLLPKQEQRTFTKTTYSCNLTRSKVEKLIEHITETGVDITDSYQVWFEIGCSLANEFGEDGREYFHLVSQYHPDYKEQATDRQFRYCLKHNYKYQINTFFHYSKIAGILLDNEKSATIAKPSFSRIKIEHTPKYLAEMIPGCPF